MIEHQSSSTSNGHQGHISCTHPTPLPGLPCVSVAINTLLQTADTPLLVTVSDQHCGKNTMQSRYNGTDFPQITHYRLPVTRPRGRDMGCLLWVQNNWPNSQIPKCIGSISLKAPFRTEMCTFLFWMMHCGIWNRCIMGFVKLVHHINVKQCDVIADLCPNFNSGLINGPLKLQHGWVIIST